MYFARSWICNPFSFLLSQSLIVSQKVVMGSFWRIVWGRVCLMCSMKVQGTILLPIFSIMLELCFLHSDSIFRFHDDLCD